MQYGSNSRTVHKIPIFLQKRIRSEIIPWFENTFPFQQLESHSQELLTQTNFETLYKDQAPVAKSFQDILNEEKHSKFQFRIGKVCSVNGKTKSNLPFTSFIFREKTTHGKIVMVKIPISATTPTIITAIVKLDPLSEYQAKSWFKDQKLLTRNEKASYLLHRQGKTYRILSKSFMDALCIVRLSQLVEARISPHFPLCYGTCLGSALLKKPSSSKCRKKTKMSSPRSQRELFQTIWMEFLPQSMFEVLQTCSEVVFWYSSLFQVAAALQIAYHHFGFIHNDCHSENIRVRKISYETDLYYRWGDQYFRVPTYGFLFVLIDFGRSFVKIEEEDAPMISSVFGPKGECNRFLFDNRNADMVRLILSIRDAVDKIKPPQDSLAFLKFCKNMTTTDEGWNVIDAMDQDPQFKRHPLYVYLERIPREQCSRSTPEDFLKTLSVLFKIEKEEIPSDITPYVIS